MKRFVAMVIVLLMLFVTGAYASTSEGATHTTPAYDANSVWPEVCPEGYYPQQNLSTPLSLEIVSCVNDIGQLWIKAQPFVTVDLSPKAGHSTYFPVESPGTRDAPSIESSVADYAVSLIRTRPKGVVVILAPDESVTFNPAPGYAPGFRIGVKVDKSRTTTSYVTELLAAYQLKSLGRIADLQDVAACGYTIARKEQAKKQTWQQTASKLLPAIQSCRSTYTLLSTATKAAEKDEAAGDALGKFEDTIKEAGLGDFLDDAAEILSDVR